MPVPPPPPSARRAGSGRSCDLLSKSIITVRMTPETKVPLKEKALISWGTRPPGRLQGWETSGKGFLLGAWNQLCFRQEEGKRH